MEGPAGYRRWSHLLLLTAAYIIGEMSHFTPGIVSKLMARDIHYGDQACLPREDVTNSSVECSTLKHNDSCDEKSNGSCTWQYTGLGLQYQILAGPTFIVVFSVSGLLAGALADKFNRQTLMAVYLSIMSAGTLGMGFSTQYWHLLVSRMVAAAGEAGFAPLSTGMISDLFPSSLHGTAIAIFTWGIYIGYGLSYITGNYVSQALTWNWSYHVVAVTGFLLLIAYIFFKDPRVEQAERKKPEQELTPSADSYAGPTAPEPSSAAAHIGLRRMFFLQLRTFTRPTMLLLLVGATLRHTAGFCWSTNTQLYYQNYFPATDTGRWLSWVSIVGGCIGVTAGGVVSDRLIRRLGIGSRIWVLAGSQLVATPFAVGTLYFPPDISFICLLVAYLFAEMWFGVVLALVIQLVPDAIKSSAIGVFLFIISNIAGSMPLAVDGLSKLVGFRESLYLLYPGMYLSSSALFLCTALLMRTT